MQVFRIVMVLIFTACLYSCSVKAAAIETKPPVSEDVYDRGLYEK